MAHNIYEQEKQEEQKKKDILCKAIKEIAKLLKLELEFSADSYACRASLKDKKSEEGLYINASKYSKWRFNISGYYPRGRKNEYITVYSPCTKERYDGSIYESIEELKDNSINISSEKHPEQIVKDIQCRFFPDYKKRLELVKKSIVDSNDYQNKSEKSLVKIINRDLTEHERERKEVSIYGLTDSKHFGDIKASEEKISINISDITPEQAKRILNIVKE